MGKGIKMLPHQQLLKAVARTTTRESTASVLVSKEKICM